MFESVSAPSGVSSGLLIVRMVDAKRHSLVYLTYSDRVIEGSPQNSVAVDRATAIPVR